MVEATSKDIGINAIMTYSIVGGNAHERFSINPDKGMCKTIWTSLENNG